MESRAVIFEEPHRMVLGEIELSPAAENDVVVEMEWTGISTGTERLLWSGRMPPFPGMGYPLVPGYEAVGRVVEAGPASGRVAGERVFVPGANCFGPVRGLFGGAASRVVVGGARVLPLDETIGEQGVLLALAATAEHALRSSRKGLPELIVGHGVLGRLLARLAVSAGGSPVVWERDPARRAGADGYEVIAPDADSRRQYRTICDVSGDHRLLDDLIGRLARGGEIILAGFYEQPLSFAFPPAFMREARITVAAQWQPADLACVKYQIETGALSLDGLITHRQAAAQAQEAYRTAFDDPACLKMILDWRPAAW
jgi:3-hydroxyethyl bacteriochlorophyllide a dehydrogenase